MSTADPSLTATTLTGATWSSFGRLGQLVVSLLSTTILARLLPPAAYGIIGMATLFTNFVGNFNDLGTASAIIQRPRLDDRLVSSVFWLNIVFGLACACALAALAPLAALFLHESQVKAVLRVLALSLAISSVSMIHSALLVRDMQFKQVALVELGSSVAGSIVAVALALRGAGVWSLVVSSVVNSLASCILFWRACSWRPMLRFHWDDVASVARYSWNLSGFALVNYFARNADNLVIGRFLGATQLGYYQLGYALMLTPIQGITSVLGRVMLPALARLQHEPQRLRSAYLRLCVSVAALSFPMMLGLFVTRREFVHVVLGPQWETVATLLLIFAPLGMVQSVLSTVGNIYLATGRTDWMFRFGLVASSIYVVSFFVGLPWGILGVATAYAIANVVLFPGCLIPFRLIALPLSSFLGALAPIFQVSLVMAAVALCWRLALGWFGLTSAWFSLFTTGLVGAAVYALLLRFRTPREVLEIFDSIAATDSPLVRQFARLMGRGPRVS